MMLRCIGCALKKACLQPVQNISSSPHLAQALLAAGISEGGTPNSSVTDTMAWPSAVSRYPTATAQHRTQA
jgi:hypothetical protein